jgi:hypothetical protein
MSFANFTNAGNLTGIGDDQLSLKLYFVSCEDAITPQMEACVEAAKDKFTHPEAVAVLSQQECLDLPKAKIKEEENGKNIFIFDEFDKQNDAFMYVYNARTV